jgi:hypothetical protein
MRIVIEIDGNAVRHVEPGETTPTPRPDVAAAPANGGAAPGADAATAAADSDGGGPSQDLLDSIRAAERGSGDGTTPSEVTDAGAGPTEF